MIALTAVCAVAHLSFVLLLLEVLLGALGLLLRLVLVSLFLRWLLSFLLLRWLLSLTSRTCGRQLA